MDKHLGVEIQESLRFAAEAHVEAGDRYGHLPYKFHLLAVLSVLFEFGETNREILVAAPLHDVVEDTPVTKEQVAALFGSRVAALVDAVSDPPGHKNRKTRKAAAYPRMKVVGGAVILKLADRIANVRSCWAEATANKQNKSLLGMYKKEYGGFRKALRPAFGIGHPSATEQAMWNELDHLLAWVE
jgi:(p)ppGpp synthase/HD superfamily hydrolase